MILVSFLPLQYYTVVWKHDHPSNVAVEEIINPNISQPLKLQGIFAPSLVLLSDYESCGTTGRCPRSQRLETPGAKKRTIFRRKKQLNQLNHPSWGVMTPRQVIVSPWGYELPLFFSWEAKASISHTGHSTGGLAMLVPDENLWCLL